MKFKVGDRVRRKSSGDIGVVRRIDTGSYGMYARLIVVFDDGREVEGLDKEFEPVKFKVGDRVRSKSTGRVGVVSASGLSCSRLCFENGDADEWIMHESLEPAEWGAPLDKWIVELSNNVASVFGCACLTDLSDLQRWIAEHVDPKDAHRVLPSDLVGRMVDLVREFATDGYGRADEPIWTECRAVAALIPTEPVDPLLLRAREIVASECDNSIARSIRDGERDHTAAVRATLRALRDGAGE